MPFSVKQVTQSFMLFAITLLESTLETQNAYLFYLMSVLVFCILSWLMFNFGFEIREEKKYKRLIQQSSIATEIDADGAQTY